MTLDRRTKVLLAVFGILLGVLGPAAIVGAEDFLAGFGTVTSGGHIAATNGPSVEMGEDYRVRSGNPTTDISVNLSTESNGYANFSSTCRTHVSADQLVGTWTNVSNLDVTSCELTIDPADKTAAGVGGQADLFKLRDGVAMDDGQVDFIYSSTGGEASVTIRNLPAENRVGARDADTDATLATATTDGSGTATFSDLDSGAHTVEIVDAPENVTIRNESAPHNVIKEANVEILVSGSGGTVSQQTVDDGNISMVGVPLDEEYIVVVDAPGYHQRSVYVPDVFEQNSIFLLNESFDSHEVTFAIEDNTGLFGEPVLEFQRAINRSVYDPDAAKKDQWTTIAGDRLGASGQYTIDLEAQSRYRIIIRQDGNMRILGEHTVDSDGQFPLTVGQIEWELPEDQQYNWSFSRVEHGGAASGEAVKFTYKDQTDETTSLTGTIHEAGNDSNVLTTFSGSGPFGQFAFTQPLTNDQANVTWQVDWSADRDSDSIGSSGVGSLQRLGSTNSLFAAVQQLDGDWRDAITAVAILGSGFIIAGIYSAIGAILVVGVAVVVWMAGFSSLGLGLVLLASVAAIGYRLAAREEL